MKSQPGTLVRSVGKQPVKYTWRLGREFCEDDTSGKDWLSKAQTFVKVVDKLMISVLFALIIQSPVAVQEVSAQIDGNKKSEWPVTPWTREGTNAVSQRWVFWSGDVGERR